MDEHLISQNAMLLTFFELQLIKSHFPVITIQFPVFYGQFKLTLNSSILDSAQPWFNINLFSSAKPVTVFCSLLSDTSSSSSLKGFTDDPRTLRLLSTKAEEKEDRGTCLNSSREQSLLTVRQAGAVKASQGEREEMPVIEETQTDKKSM